MLLSLLKHGTAKQEPPSDITRMVFERVRGGERGTCVRGMPIAVEMVKRKKQTDRDAPAGAALQPVAP